MSIYVAAIRDTVLPELIISSNLQLLLLATNNQFFNLWKVQTKISGGSA